MAFRIASSPYTHDHHKTNNIMRWVILACIPGVLAQTYFFGYGSLIQIIIACLCATFTEALVLRLRHLPVGFYLRDNSALLTAVLLAVSLPPLAPWWIVIIGTIFAIVIAKQLYGGLGQNPFNPAMVGYVVLLISFPVQMTSWLPPITLQLSPLSVYDTLHVILTGTTTSGSLPLQAISGIDAITQATPLDALKTGLRNNQNISQIMQQPIYNQLAGLGWLWVNVGFLLGGLILLSKNYIQWQIPLSFLSSLAICAAIAWWVDPQTYASPLFHLFSGATMLGAFFIATDPVTAATTIKGRLLFGGLIGFLVWLIRTKGGYPDAVAFAVLLANITVPLIDHYTQPRVYGH